MDEPFWEKPLEELDRQQWEALCDGCGRCCLQKLQDDESEEIVFTSVSCEYLNTETCRCMVYPDRVQKKANCSVIDRDNPEHFDWLPVSCAYRLRHQNQPLPSWHPLLVGSDKEMRRLGIKVSQWCVSELNLLEDEWVNHILDDF